LVEKRINVQEFKKTRCVVCRYAPFSLCFDAAKFIACFLTDEGKAEWKALISGECELLLRVAG